MLWLQSLMSQGSTCRVQVSRSGVRVNVMLLSVLRTCLVQALGVDGSHGVKV